MEKGRLKKKELVTSSKRVELLSQLSQISVDSPDQFISRISLNSPRLSNSLRGQLLEQLQLNDQDPDVRVTIITSSGEDFCLGSIANDKDVLPTFTNESDGEVVRNLVQMWMEFEDLAKPVIASVHGQCLGTGMDLATACDLVYVTEDAVIGYPAVRNHGLPDFQALPWLVGMRNSLGIMLTGETMSGAQSVGFSWANDFVKGSKKELDEFVLGKARRVAKIPSDLLAYNKRSVYRAFEAMGMRNNLRHSVDLQALMWHSASAGILRRAEQRAANTPAVSHKPAVSTPQITTSPATERNPSAVNLPQKVPEAPKTIPIEKKPEPKIEVEAKEDILESKEAEKEVDMEVHEEVENMEAEAQGVSEVLELIAGSGMGSNMDYLLGNANVTLDIHINEPLKVHLHNYDEDSETRSKL